jgi:hypothetical protein
MGKILSLITLSLLSFNLYALDFSEGPYGSEYFDTAGPFTVEDLNATPVGDLNGSGTINIQDVILIIQYVIGNADNSTWSEDGDINNDSYVDVLDIILLINSILSPQEASWDFETRWDGEDCYIFLNYTSSSGALFISTTKEELLNNSPDNVHYFFISDRASFYSDIVNLKNDFDEILLGMSPDLQDHWNKHLHFIPQKTSSLNNWLEESLSGEDAIGIDRFQRIRETGYFGNPASFTGTYIHYLAFEALILL